MKAVLHVRPEGADAFDVEIGNTATIGRGGDNTVALPGCSHLSRQHAVLRCQDAYQYQLMDLGSRNGTFLDGRRVILPVTVSDRSVIGLPGAEITVSVVDEAEQDEGAELTVAAVGGSAVSDIETVAMLLCDLRGFSTMSEVLREDDLARTLGQWFREAGLVVQAAGGIVDKFIGDAMLAYWIETKPPTAARRAIETARSLDRLAGLRTWPDPEKQPMRTAVALHYGSVSSGNIGLVAQRDATIIGDAVNTVFRIEAVMKELGRSPVLSREVLAAFDGTPPHCDDLGEHALKGKQQTAHLLALRET